MVGHGGSSAGSYLVDPTSPIPSHYAVIILCESVTVHQLSWLALRELIDKINHFGTIRHLSYCIYFLRYSLCLSLHIGANEHAKLRNMQIFIISWITVTYVYDDMIVMTAMLMMMMTTTTMMTMTMTVMMSIIEQDVVLWDNRLRLSFYLATQFCPSYLSNVIRMFIE